MTPRHLKTTLGRVRCRLAERVVNWRGWFRSRPPLRRSSDRDGTGIRIAIAMPVEPVTGTERRVVVVPRVRYNKRPHEESRRSSTRKRLPKTAVFAEFQPRWTSPEHVDDPGGTKPRIPPTWLDLKRGQGMDAASDDDRLNKPPPERSVLQAQSRRLPDELPRHGISHEPAPSRCGGDQGDGLQSPSRRPPSHRAAHDVFTRQFALSGEEGCQLQATCPSKKNLRRNPSLSLESS